MIIGFPHPKTQFIRITPNQRRRIETLVQDLVNLLDFIDGDEDAEDNGYDEPWLGWGLGGALENSMATDDREEENEHGGDILDEPHDDGEDAEEDFRGCELA